MTVLNPSSTHTPCSQQSHILFGNSSHSHAACDSGQTDFTLPDLHMGHDGCKEHDLTSLVSDLLKGGHVTKSHAMRQKSLRCFRGKLQLLKWTPEGGTKAPFSLITVVPEWNSWNHGSLGAAIKKIDFPRKAKGRRSFTTSSSSLLNLSSQQAFLLYEIITFLMVSASLSLLKQKQHSRAYQLSHHLLRKLCDIPTAPSEVTS